MKKFETTGGSADEVKKDSLLFITSSHYYRPPPNHTNTRARAHLNSLSLSKPVDRVWS